MKAKNNIEDILNKKNISIKKLGEDLNITYKGIHNLVKREYLDSTIFGTLLKVADYLDVDIKELYTIER